MDGWMNGWVSKVLLATRFLEVLLAMRFHILKKQRLMRMQATKCRYRYLLLYLVLSSVAC